MCGVWGREEGSGGRVWGRGVKGRKWGGGRGGRSKEKCVGRGKDAGVHDKTWTLHPAVNREEYGGTRWTGRRLSTVGGGLAGKQGWKRVESERRDALRCQMLFFCSRMQVATILAKSACSASTGAPSCSISFF